MLPRCSDRPVDQCGDSFPALIDGPSTDDASVRRADVELVQCQLRPHGPETDHQATIASQQHGIVALGWAEDRAGQQLPLISRVVRPEAQRVAPGHARMTEDATGRGRTYRQTYAPGMEWGTRNAGTNRTTWTSTW